MKTKFITMIAGLFIAAAVFIGCEKEVPSINSAPVVKGSAIKSAEVVDRVITQPSEVPIDCFVYHVYCTHDPKHPGGHIVATIGCGAYAGEIAGGVLYPTSSDPIFPAISPQTTPLSFSIGAGMRFDFTNVITGASFTLYTDESGKLNPQNIPAGTYDIKVSKSGYVTAYVEDLAIADADEGLGFSVHLQPE